MHIGSGGIAPLPICALDVDDRSAAAVVLKVNGVYLALKDCQRIWPQEDKSGLAYD